MGTGLETLLRLERYDVRRIARLAERGSLPESWRPDVALVDGLLLKNGDRAALGAPAFVLSGDAARYDAVRARLDDVRGWLRKDAAVAAGTSAFLVWGWLALRSAG